MTAPTTRKWSLTSSPRPGGADPFSPRLEEIIDLIRDCALDEAYALATEVRESARSAANDVAAGRASSFLGEIAGMRGNLGAAMREYGTAIEHLEQTDLAGSISRAYRGWAYCYLMFRMPRLALQPALEAARIAGLIDVPAVKQRAEFECAICEGLVQIELQRFGDAEASWRAVEGLVARMALVDDWLPGLHSMLGGRILIERGASEGDWRSTREGVRTLEEVAAHFGDSGLRFWQAWTLDALGRAREEENRDAAVHHVRRAVALYREIGSEHLYEAAEQWLRSAAPQTGARYGVSPAKARRSRIAADAQTIEGQYVAGPKTKELFERATRFGQLVHPVLVMGESGTGKEGLARIIHAASDRSARQMVPLNCGAVPEPLFESTLFGHRKGAFTGASTHHIGVIREADGGTLFLDEIGDLPLALQPKLLRFLETGKTLAVGDSVERPVDVRIIAATNRNLEQAVNRGEFREDLYYRLNVLRLSTIPLRERLDEVARLAQQFASEQGAHLTVGALNALASYDWPGNVRQLANVIRRALALAETSPAVISRHVAEKALVGERQASPSPGGTSATSSESPTAVGSRDPYPFLTACGELPAAMTLPEAEREFQRYHIARVLTRHNGNKTRAARELGLKLQTLAARVRKLELD